MKVPRPKDPVHRLILDESLFSVLLLVLAASLFITGHPWWAVAVLALLAFMWLAVWHLLRTFTVLDEELGRELAGFVRRFSQGDVHANDEVEFFAYRVTPMRAHLFRQLRRDVDEALSDLLAGARQSTVPVDMFHIIGKEPPILVERFQDAQTVALGEEGKLQPIPAPFDPQVAEERDARRPRLYRAVAKHLRLHLMEVKYVSFYHRTGASRVTREEVRELIEQLRAVLDAE